MEFNADGSLKLSGTAAKQIDEEHYRMQSTRCVKIVKDATNTYSPKLCTLTINVSPVLEKNFVNRTFSLFSSRVDSTVKLIKLSDAEFQVTIGPEFSRCHYVLC